MDETMISNKRYHNIKLHQKLNTLQAETGKLLYHIYFIIHHYAQGWVFAMAKTIFAGTVEKTGKNRGKN